MIFAIEELNWQSVSLNIVLSSLTSRAGGYNLIHSPIWAFRQTVIYLFSLHKEVNSAATATLL